MVKFKIAAHRFRSGQPVSVHQLICQGTVEERIHLLQAKKSQLAESLFSAAARPAAAPIQEAAGKSPEHG